MTRQTVLLMLAGLLTGLGGATWATSAVTEKLTIEQAVAMALENNPEVRKAQREVATAQARVGAARSGYFPQVTFNGIGKLGLSGATNGLGLLGLPASPFWQNLADAGNVNQNIYDFGRTRHAASIRRAEVEAARHALDQVRIEVAERAKVAFLELLSTQRIIEVKQQDVREREAVQRKAREFYEAGLTSKLDFDLAQVGLSSAELALAPARDDEQAAWVELYTALGQPAPAGQPGGTHYTLVEPQFTLTPPDSLLKEIDRALATRPDLKALEAQVEAQQERVNYARSLRRPLLNGVFSGGYARFAELTASRLMVGGLGLFAPIYTGGGLASRVGAEQDNLEALRAQYQSEVLGVRDQVSRAHTDLLKSLEATQDNQKIAAYAEEALRLARTRYEAQLVSFVDLLTAETAAESARANYAQAIYDYEIAKAHLNRAMDLEP